MELAASVIQGTITPEGTLQLDQQPNLAPGRVQVIVQSLPALPSDDPFWHRMEAIWEAQRKAHHVPRDASEIEEQTRAVREEWEQRSIKLDEQRDG
jgi:hypothetical protein